MCIFVCLSFSPSNDSFSPWYHILQSQLEKLLTISIVLITRIAVQTIYQKALVLKEQTQESLNKNMGKSISSNYSISAFGFIVYLSDQN